MKKEFEKCTEAFNESELYGFSWIEYTAAVTKLVTMTCAVFPEPNTNSRLKIDNLCGLIFAILRCRPCMEPALLRPPPCLAKIILANLCLFSIGN